VSREPVGVCGLLSCRYQEHGNIVPFLAKSVKPRQGQGNAIYFFQRKNSVSVNLVTPF
jgi:hypothetical protein